ncbi:hypothetical protein RvY_14463 [Ramazzottius varieornatus]|uniref:Uncharacterized protein n=1 Tax=Ramazzottius varieornatus TaxID=947166 RepID=A0A1D1VZU4_RAMVA|nr:hypothetical protein RvY_14463 [Ramazzottius varieornatus]
MESCIDRQVALQRLLSLCQGTEYNKYQQASNKVEMADHFLINMRGDEASEAGWTKKADDGGRQASRLPCSKLRRLQPLFVICLLRSPSGPSCKKFTDE